MLFLNRLITATGSIATLFYSVYSLDHDVIGQFGTEKLIYAIPFVVVGVFSYMFCIKGDKEGDLTQVVIRDKGLAVAIALWIVLVSVIIYSNSA